MLRKILIGIAFVLIVVGLTMHRALPQRLQESAPVQSATAVNAVNAKPEISPVPETYYPITKVVDGDTIVVNMNGKNETIRLIGLDTPETVDPRKPVQCFGEEASKKAKELLTGKMVRIEVDPSQGERDKYGRLLAYVFLENAVFFNQLMISEGYGHEYTYNLPYKYQKEFKEAEKTAREEKRGLWAKTIAGDCSPEPASQGEAGFRATGFYECTRNTYNCSSFKTQVEAQYVFELCGGNQNDIHKLDSDMDGKVCESLP